MSLIDGMKEVILSAPFQISVEGEFKEEQTVYLRSPNLANQLGRNKARELKQLTSRAVLNATKFNESRDQIEQPQDDGAVPDGSAFMEMVTGFSDNINKFYEVFRELAPLVVVIGDGEQKIKFLPAHWDKISMEDQDKILGEFLVNFIVSLDTSRKKT